MLGLIYIYIGKIQAYIFKSYIDCYITAYYEVTGNINIHGVYI